MKLYILTEINIVDYDDVERTPKVFLAENIANKAFKERIKEISKYMKDDWVAEKGKRHYCQYEDGYASRNSDTLRLFEVEI